jgi:hypothetical protein
MGFEEKSRLTRYRRIMRAIVDLGRPPDTQFAYKLVETYWPLYSSSAKVPIEEIGSSH